MTKAGKGGLKDTPLDGIVFKLLEQVVQVSFIELLPDGRDMLTEE